MYGLWFASIPGMTAFKRQLLIEECGTAEEVYRLSEAAILAFPGLSEEDRERIIRSRRTWELEAEWMRLQESGVGFVTVEDEAYPRRLMHIPKAPYGLFYLGRLPKEEAKSVAIVGARGRSAYGMQLARELSSALASAGVEVISGMARGIDADGHRGALDAGGRTYAVLGCGVDVCYPKENRYLYENIPAKGGIISEYPMRTNPQPMLFPQRNRIIAGLADYTVVVEARTKSGSLITADCALEQGKEVYALPGRVTDPLSCGCNQLIRQGAGVLTSVEDFLKELSLSGERPSGQMDFQKILLEKEERLVYSLFDFAPLGIGSMVMKSGLGLSELLEILERLEQKGFIEEIVTNYYIRKC